MRAKKTVSETILFEPFKDLKKIIEGKGLKISGIPPVAKKDVPPNDDELFVIAMREVREIKEFRKIPFQRRKVIALCRKMFPDKEAIKALDEIVAGKRAMHLPDTQEYVEWINQDYRGDCYKKAP